MDDRMRVLINPDFFAQLEIPHIAGVMLHETSHVVRDHGGRAIALGITQNTMRRWNLAADAEINDDLLLDGVPLPDSRVTPDDLGQPWGRSAESYYWAAWTEPRRELSADCGSGCHGIDDNSTRHLVGLPEGLSDAELLVLRHTVATDIARYRRQRIGSIGAGWSRWAEAILEPKISWQTMLRSKVRAAWATEAGMVDYTYRQLSRRRVRGVVLPAMTQPLPSVAVVIDTSASMDDGALSRAWVEVRSCLAALGGRRDRLAIYATDAATVRITDLAARRVELFGGGGTDMTDGICTALDGSPRPNLLIVITDGLTPWPSASPPCPMIVVLVGAVQQLPDLASLVRSEIPAWAEVIVVDDHLEALPAGGR